MLTQSQPDVAVVFNDVVAIGHLPERDPRSCCSAIAVASRSAAAANNGKGSSRSALIAQCASRRSSLSDGRKASASASWTSASVGTLDRRHISSTEANALFMRAATIRAASATASPLTCRKPSGQHVDR